MTICCKGTDVAQFSRSDQPYSRQCLKWHKLNCETIFRGQSQMKGKSGVSSGSFIICLLAWFRLLQSCSVWLSLSYNETFLSRQCPNSYRTHCLNEWFDDYENDVNYKLWPSSVLGNSSVLQSLPPTLNKLIYSFLEILKILINLFRCVWVWGEFPIQRHNSLLHYHITTHRWKNQLASHDRFTETAMLKTCHSFQNLD